MSPMVKTPLTIEHALLGFLRERPMHAYEIYQTLTRAEALGLVWHLKQSQLYALLGRLEEEGYLVATTEPQGTRPPRRVLALTTLGRDAFADWLAAPVAHGRDFRLEFLAKLFFAAQDGRSTLDALIAAQRKACQGWIEEIQAQIARVPRDRLFDDLVLRFRLGQIEATLSWLDTCASVLDAPFIC